jgi:tetratricopeptide (TPR) repeat protein
MTLISLVVIALGLSFSFQDVSDLQKQLRSIERLAGNPKPSEKVENDLAKKLAALVKTHPEEPAVMFWLGDVQERQLKYDDALAVWQRAATLPSVLPKSEADRIKARICIRISQGLLGKLDGEGAEKASLQAMSLDPLNAAGSNSLLESAFRTGRLSEAVAALKNAASKHGAESPNLVVVYHDALARIGEWDAIKADLAAQPADRRRPEDYHHFQARIAEIDGRKLDAFLYHYLASVGGADVAATTIRSRDAIEKIRFKDETEMPNEIVPYAKALYQLDRADVNPDKRTAGIVLPSEDAEPARLASRYIQVRCDAAAGKPTIDAWRSLLKDYPSFAPIYVGLAEAIEAETPDSDEIQSLLAKAESLSPTNGIVREHFRMGAGWKPTKDGVAVISVEPDTAWGRYGIGPGDELLELDDVKLSSFPIHHRMSYVRGFLGGRVVYKPMGFSNTVERDLELTFFD